MKHETYSLFLPLQIYEHLLLFFGSYAPLTKIPIIINENLMLIFMLTIYSQWSWYSNFGRRIQSKNNPRGRKYASSVKRLTLRELSSSSPHRKQNHGHVTGKHIATHSQSSPLRKKKACNTQPLDSGARLAAVCSKIIARCSQSTVHSGREKLQK